MAGEKYVVATAENPLQITIRNILNPHGYMFLANCNDPISLLRLIRSYSPDFVIVDLGMKIRELKSVLDTIDDELLCACIGIGESREIDTVELVENSKIITLNSKLMNNEIFINTVELANLYYKRICRLNSKLKETTENFETRKVVERAKWILIERDGISENEAYERMRKKSMDSRISLKSIAEAIIFTNELANKR